MLTPNILTSRDDNPVPGAATFVVELESIRGLAALAVVASHAYAIFNAFNMRGDLAVLQYILSRYVRGSDAVAIFFILSGYVLLVQLHNKDLRNPRTVGSYWLGRGLRLLPPMWASIVVAVPCAQLLGYPSPITPELFISTLVLLDIDLNGALWSMRFELICSALYPLALLGLSAFPNSAKVPVLLGVAAFFLFRVLGSGVVATQFATVGLFLLGAIAFLLRHRYAALSPVSRSAVGWVSVAAYMAAGPVKQPLHTLLIAIAGLGLVLWAVQNAGRQATAFLRHPALRFIGRISYSLYLLHFPINSVARVIISWMFPLNEKSDNLFILSSVNFLLVIVPVIPIAWLSYRWIEVPTIEIGRRIRQHQASSLAATPRS